MRKLHTALVVDDDDAFRRQIQSSLRRKGVSAKTSATLEEGLISLEQDTFDFIVMDFRMPRGRNGLEFMKHYRKLAQGSVIIMLTGFGDIDLAIKAIREGADSLLTKPIDVDRLLKEVSHVLDSQVTFPRNAAISNTFNLEQVEEETIKAALKESSHVISLAAKLLGIDRRTLQRKMKKIF